MALFVSVATVVIFLIVAIVVGNSQPGRPTAAACHPPATGVATATVPNLVGQSLDQAKRQLCSLGFANVTTKDAKPGSSRSQIDDSNWVIVSQLPNPESPDVAVTTVITLGVVKKDDAPIVTVYPPAEDVTENDTFAAKLGGCTSDSVGFVHAKGTIVNKSSRSRTFTITVDLIDANNVKVGDAFTVLSLDPGQTGAYEAVSVTSYKFTMCKTSVDD